MDSTRPVAQLDVMADVSKDTLEDALSRVGLSAYAASAILAATTFGRLPPDRIRCRFLSGLRLEMTDLDSGDVAVVDLGAAVNVA